MQRFDWNEDVRQRLLFQFSIFRLLTYSQSSLFYLRIFPRLPNECFLVCLLFLSISTRHIIALHRSVFYDYLSSCYFYNKTIFWTTTKQWNTQFIQSCSPSQSISHSVRMSHSTNLSLAFLFVVASLDFCFEYMPYSIQFSFYYKY